MGGSSAHLFIWENAVGRVAREQVFALDLLDKLYFNQLLIFCAMDKSERNWLKKITDRIEQCVNVAGYRGTEAEIAKHGVLCLAEISLADDIFDINRTLNVDHPPMDPEIQEKYPELKKYFKTYAQSWVVAFYRHTKNFDLLDVQEIAQDISEDYRDAPAVIRYKLAERCFSFQYASAPIDCLWHFAKYEILNGKKYPKENLVGEINRHFMIRLMMLCEFMEIRRHLKRASSRTDLYHTLRELSEKPNYIYTRDKLIDYSNRRYFSLADPAQKKKYACFDLNEIESPEQYRIFLDALGRRHAHYRLDSSILGGWLGTLGAAEVEIIHASPENKRSLYTEINNTGTITDSIVKKFQEKGFSITARTLYERRKSLSTHAMPCVKHYYACQKKLDTAINPELDDISYLGVVPQWNAKISRKRRVTLQK